MLAEIYRLWAHSWRFELQDAELLESGLHSGPVVLAFWHGEQMPMVFAHRDRKFVGMASKSRDGELLARVIGRLGYDVVRGSSSRGGAQALRQCLSVLRAGQSPALAVDGPRGPYRQPHGGAVTLASLSGRPIVFGVSHASPCRRLASWDRFVVPAPGARVRVAYGVLEVPREADIEAARVELGRRMTALSERLQSG